MQQQLKSPNLNVSAVPFSEEKTFWGCFRGGHTYDVVTFMDEAKSLGLSVVTFPILGLRAGDILVIVHGIKGEGVRVTKKKGESTEVGLELLALGVVTGIGVQARSAKGRFVMQKVHERLQAAGVGVAEWFERRVCGVISGVTYSVELGRFIEVLKEVAKEEKVPLKGDNFLFIVRCAPDKVFVPDQPLPLSFKRKWTRTVFALKDEEVDALVSDLETPATETAIDLLDETPTPAVQQSGWVLEYIRTLKHFRRKRKVCDKCGQNPPVTIVDGVRLCMDCAKSS